MELIPAAEFLSYARHRGIGPDERYGPPRCLIHLPDRPHHRFWPVPPRAAQVPAFVRLLLEAVDPWDMCDLWPRNGWAHAGYDRGPYDPVAGLILRAAGVRPDVDGAVRYADSERAKLTAAVFAAAVFGWCVSNDYFVVPDHGRQLIHFDHDGAAHVSFADAAAVEPFVERMRQAGHPLPTDVPDATLKRPGWMP